MSHVMIDIETLGTTPGSVILSVGAVTFGPRGLGSEFYRAIDLDAPLLGLTIDPKTVAWWSRQSDEARAAAFQSEDTNALAGVLLNLYEWFRHNEGEQVWCHGATFDVPLLDAAYRAANITVPWRFNMVCCTRTLYELASVSPNRAQGVHHHALNDAKVQALAAIEAHKKLGIW